ncbi:MAG: peptide-methionine (S)-S-oxide reductase MsrA [Candidatus Aenigmarchaeota archaeon]|nr:peptide-methionine (S)-S-oxide reductase MsrA [Candidatus Aenigmarchaeota archaeon]
MKTKTGKATFAAGCFWGVQAAFDEVKGVVSTTVGYTGGHAKNPTYKDVCTGATNHAEAIEIIFDPKKVSFEKLLELFWKIHDPTQVNRQGPDVGSQYRSAVFYHDEEQKKIAEKSKQTLENTIMKKVATEITKASAFYPAEAYHQKYYLTHPNVC